MVKNKGKKLKRKGASLEEAFGTDKPADDGWTTGSAAAMLMDEDEQPAAAAPDMIDIDEPGGKKKKGKRRNRQQQQHLEGGAMDTGEGHAAAAGKPKASSAVSKVPGLGVVTHSMKRGDRTTKQKRRKVEKLTKALARSDKAGVRIDSKSQKKQAKVTLKHLY